MLRSNPHIGTARAKKVKQLCEQIDHIVATGCFTGSIDDACWFRERLPGMLSVVDREWWEHVARMAKVNPPSRETIASIVAHYRERTQ